MLLGFPGESRHVNYAAWLAATETLWSRLPSAPTLQINKQKRQVEDSLMRLTP